MYSVCRNESEAARGTENEICQSRILECLGLDDIDSITRESTFNTFNLTYDV